MTVPSLERVVRPRRRAATARARRSSSLIGEAFRAGRPFGIDATAGAGERRRALREFSARLQG